MYGIWDINCFLSCTFLVFEGEDQAFRFGASSEAVRDEWIQALHIASHECLKMQLQSLREQLQIRTGNDLVHLPMEPNSTVDFEAHSGLTWFLFLVNLGNNFI